MYLEKWGNRGNAGCSHMNVLKYPWKSMRPLSEITDWTNSYYEHINLAVIKVSLIFQVH